MNKVITRSSGEVNQCYDSLKAISGGQFDELPCDDPGAMRLFATDTVGELQVSPLCPYDPLRVIIDRPDTAYCLAPPYLGQAQAPRTDADSDEATPMTIVGSASTGAVVQAASITRNQFQHVCAEQTRFGRSLRP